MTRKIFRNTMIVVLMVVLLSGASIVGVLYDYFNRELTQEMGNELNYIAAGVDCEGMTFLDNIGEQKARITWVGKDGTVLFDNQVDITTMENHANRTEIKEAMTSMKGTSTRYSSTLSEKTIYYAQRLSDGSVIRIANKQYSVVVILLGILQPIIVVLVCAFAISGFLAYRLSKQIIKPLDTIDLDNPEEMKEYYEELAPFMRKIVCQNREIQEKMRELNTQKQDFTLITENMQEGFIVLDSNATILSHNSSALRLLGIKFDVEQKNVLVLDRTEEFHNAINAALDGRHNELVLTRGEKYFHIYINPVFHTEVETKLENDSSVAGAIIVITDVTEKEERENLRREFSANVSHELKTPLTSISGIAEIIKNGIVDEADIPKFADKIYTEAKRLINLVEDIIRVSQLDETQVTDEKEQIDLYDMAKHVLTYIKPAAGERGIRLKVEADNEEAASNPFIVVGVRSIIEEMIYNLCDNAIKYNKDNGKVEVKVWRKDKHISISVSDTGIGIQKDQQERVFERFYRVDKSHSKEIGGTGLGLSIVKHGAMFHNAVITTDSELGKGTTITITF